MPETTERKQEEYRLDGDLFHERETKDSHMESATKGDGRVTFQVGVVKKDRPAKHLGTAQNLENTLKKGWGKGPCGTPVGLCQPNLPPKRKKRIPKELKKWHQEQ